MENEFPTQENWTLIEPVFEDKPLKESSWGNLVEVIQQVNRLKARLLASLYEETRTAYQKYKMIRDQAIADYAQQRTEDAAHNEEINEQIRCLEEELRALESDSYRERDTLQKAWADAYRKARIEAGKYGINLKGHALIELETDAETLAQAVVGSPAPQSTPTATESADAPSEAQPRRALRWFLFGSRPNSTPASPATALDSPLSSPAHSPAEPSRPPVNEVPTPQRSDAFLANSDLPAVASAPRVPSREEIREDIKQLLREEFRETLLAIGRATVEPTDEPAPLTDVAVHEASKTWARYYVHFLDVLTQALQECKDGTELAESTHRLMNEITRTYLQET